jgi:hypothetical protein
MSAPNIVAVATITAKEAAVLLAGTATDILSNGSGSGKVLKVNGVRFTNFDGVVNYDGTLNLVKASGPTTFVYGYHTVPAKGAVRYLGKDETIYLEEGDKLSGFGSTTNKLNAFVSYEELS